MFVRIKSLWGGRKRTISLRGRNKKSKKSKKYRKVKSINKSKRYRKVKSINKSKRYRKVKSRKRRRTGGIAPAAAARPNNAAEPSIDPLDIFYTIEDSPEVTYEVLENIRNNKIFDVDIKNPNQDSINERIWLYSVADLRYPHLIFEVKKKYPEFAERYEKYYEHCKPIQDAQWKKEKDENKPFTSGYLIWKRCLADFP